MNRVIRILTFTKNICFKDHLRVKNILFILLVVLFSLIWSWGLILELISHAFKIMNAFTTVAIWSTKNTKRLIWKLNLISSITWVIKYVKGQKVMPIEMNRMKDMRHEPVYMLNKTTMIKVEHINTNLSLLITLVIETLSSISESRKIYKSSPISNYLTLLLRYVM